MGHLRFTEDFKIDAVKQITERGYSVGDVSQRLGVSTHSLYAWLKKPFSKRAREDQRQTELLKEAWQDSGKVYGYRKLHDDLRDQGETCCSNRVVRLARLAGIKAQIGYKRRATRCGGKPSVAIGNTLNRQFEVNHPDRVWVTDITYIKTYEGFAYLAVVIDLCSRKVVGWSLPEPPNNRSGSAGPAHGCLAQEANDNGPYPFRSGIAVHQH